MIHDQVLLTRGGCTGRRRRPDKADRHCINSTSLHLLLLGFWPWSSILIPKRRDPQEIFCILWKRKFITVFTTGHHYSWFWAKCTEFTTFRYFLRFILILPFLRLRFNNRLFSSGVFFSPMRARCTFHLIYFDFITLKMYGEDSNIWTSSLRHFLQTSVISCLWGATLFLRFLTHTKQQVILYTLYGKRICL